jgi:hypothetical protein
MPSFLSLSSNFGPIVFSLLVQQARQQLVPAIRLDPGVDRGCLQPRQAAAENVTVLPGEFLGQRLTE